MLALGIVAAVASSLLYNTSIALQALEVRKVPDEHSLRPSLLGRLLRNSRWLGATAIGFLGWPLEIAALLLAPLTVVQPCIASGLVLLLWLGVEEARRDAGAARAALGRGDRRRGHRNRPGRARPLDRPRRGRRDRARPGPARDPDRAALPGSRESGAAVTLAVFSAGCGYAWTAIASKLLTDELAAGAVVVGAAWLVTAAASEGVALLSEQSALQRRPATRVAPVMFAVQVLVPVVLAPLIFDESWRDTPLGGAALVGSVAVAVAGIVVLAGSRAVGAVLESAHSEN